MNEDVVSFIISDMGSPNFTLVYFFFNSIPIEKVRFSLVKESTYFKGTEVGRIRHAVCFVFSLCEHRNKDGCVESRKI